MFFQQLFKKLHGDRKINYYDFLMETNNKECIAAVIRMVPRIDLIQINAFVDNVPYISDLKKNFYKEYLAAKYNLIIHPACDKMIAK